MPRFNLQVKRLYTILITIAIAFGANAQKGIGEGWCIGAFGGATSFAGDVMPNKISDDKRITDTRYDFGIVFEKIVLPGINFRIAGSYGQLNGIKDVDAVGKAMNQSFESNFFDYHFDLKLDPLKLVLGEGFPFSAYAMTGIGGLTNNAHYEHIRTKDNKVIEKDTTVTALMWPIGVGAGVDVGPLHVFAEGSWNIAFTDALDAHASNNKDHWVQDSYLTFVVGATYEFGGGNVGGGGAHYGSNSKAKSGATHKAQKHRHKSSKNLHKRTSSYRKRAMGSRHRYNSGGRSHVKSKNTNSSNAHRKYPVRY